MLDPRWRTLDDLIEAFRSHLARTRGTRRHMQHAHGRYVRTFLQGVFVDGSVDLQAFGSADVIAYVTSLARQYKPSTVHNARAALGAFFRFLRIEGVRDDRLEEALPSVPMRRLVGLPRYIDADQVEQLIKSLDRSTPTAKRDRAMILCVARLGLRCHEVVGIRIEDLEWRGSLVHIRSRKTGHGATLPIPTDVGAAIVDYLRHGRPETPSRHVFVLHHLRVGEPATHHTLYDAVSVAVHKAGIQAPSRGPNLLRHSLATRLIRSRASLSEIADLLGHRCLETTQIYAKLDLPSLRDVAQPWPEVKP